MMLMMLMRRFGATGELSLPFRREMPSQVAPWKSGGNWHVRTASVQCEIALYFTGAADGLKVDLGKDLEKIRFVLRICPRFVHFNSSVDSWGNWTGSVDPQCSLGRGGARSLQVKG